VEGHAPALAPGDPEGFDPRLLAALWSLPPRARATVVLRYVEDRSEAETAAALGCSVGAVKSAASRGLARLREVLVDHPADEAADEATATGRAAGGRTE
jgi:DNA-directed RNA polymerase specialized sigma24 family protein